MVHAIPPLHDPARLAALRATGLLDSLPTEHFDRLTRLVSRVLDVPVALVSLVDAERQFFPSQTGLPEPWAGARQTPLSHSFCQHVVASGDALVIPDARVDRRVRANPAIADLGVVAYAGVPLVTAGGEVLGALCAIDREPRPWRDDEVATLRDLAAAVMREVELHAEVARRHAAEEALRGSEARFRALIENAPDVVDILDADGTVRYVSPAVERLLGWTPEEVQGRSSLDLLDPAQLPEITASLGGVASRAGRGPVVLLRMRHRDGSWRVMEAQSTNLLHDPAIRGIVVNARDVTDRERGLAAARVEQERYRLLVEAVQDYAIFALDAEGRVATWNAGAERIQGRRADEVVGRPASVCLPPEEAAALPARLQAAAAGGRMEREGWCLRGDGTRFWAHEVITALRGADGELLGFTAVVRDLTAQRDAGEALRRSEARLSAIISSAMDAIVSVDEGQRVVLFNEAAERIFGYPAAEIVGQPLERLIPARFRGGHPGKVLGFGRKGGGGKVVQQAGSMLGLRADGSEFPLEATISQVQAAGERIFTVILRDITERVQQEEELTRLVGQELEARERVTRILESINDGFFAVDRDWRFTYVNRRAESQWRRPRRTLLGRVIWDEFPELRDSTIGRAYEEAMRTGRDRRLEALVPETGRWFEARAYPSADGLSIFFQDTTELKQAEEALRQSEERLRLSLEAGGMGTWELDLRLGRVVADEANCALFGLDPAERDGTGVPFHERIEPDDRAAVAAVWERAMTEGRPFSTEFRVRLPDGSLRWIAGFGRPQVEDGRVVRIVGVNQDVTETHLTEEGLRVSEERLALVLESTHDALWDWRLDQDFTYQSPRYARMLGYGPDEMETTGEGWRRLVHPDDLPAVRERLEAHFAGHTANVEAEYRLRCADGRWKWVLDRGKVVEWSAEGRPVRMVGAVTDVDERKRMEAALVSSERDYRGLFDNAHDAVVILNPATERVLEANARACEIYGVPHDDFVGRSMLEFSAHPTAGPEHVRRTLAGEGIHEFETVQRRADGRPLYLEVRASPVTYRGRQAILSVNRDIGARRLLEEQLRQSQKMEAVGRLAGGIAHDFNNVLMAVSGHTKLLLRQTPPDAPGYWSLEEIRKGAERATALTRQLLAFSRRQVLQPRVLDLNAVIEGMDGMLGRLLGEDVELVSVLEPALGSVRADQGQVEQVLMNLAVNARDAMPDGGVLRIATSHEALTEEDARRFPYVQPGPFVCVEVRDTGTGMDSETMAHLFEPFFTTKEPGKGTGLGLAMVYGIVKQSGGYVWAESHPGVGSAFRVFLPRLDEPRPPVPAPPPVALPDGGRETVLLVEDDRAVRVLVRTVLARAGYTVVEAGDGEEALAVAAAHAGPLDLLLTDVVMPRMRGVELARRLEESRPGIGVLFMSGYAEALHRSMEIGEPSADFLQKPVDPDRLLRRVRELLDARKGDGR